MKRFISFSGGVESSTMCLLYGKGATAIWCDTGAEHELMYARINEMETFLTDYHNGDFSLVRLRPTVTYNGKIFTGLEALAIGYSFMPSGQKRYCTRKFKSEPIDAFLQSQGECELMIGMNADEEWRIGSLEAMPNVTYTYPLITDGHSRADCEAMLSAEGIKPNFPVYMLRGECRMCFFKSKKEYKAMYHLNRAEFDAVMGFEEAIQDRRQKFYSIMSNGISLRQLAVECEREAEFMQGNDWAELYKSLKAETSCGAFCHR